MNTKETALNRAEMIVKVRAGLMTAKAAALTLGVSRKTYYEWEKKGLSAMLSTVEDEPPGRPQSGPTPEVLALQGQVKELSAKLDTITQTAELRHMLRLLERRDAKKKLKRSKGSSP
jgi:transposase